MGKPNKKNKQQQQARRSSAPPPAANASSAPSAEARQEVAALVEESEIACSLVDVGDPPAAPDEAPPGDRKSTRLNSSHRL